MTTALVRPELLYAWKGPSLLIVSMRGECGPEHPLSGFYFREARFLRTLRLEINGQPPWLCETASVDPESLAMNFVHPEIAQPGGGGTGQSGDEEAVDARGLPERSLDIRLSYHLEVAALDIVLAITNSARRQIRFELAWSLSADYADIQEAQSDTVSRRQPLAWRRATRRSFLVTTMPSFRIEPRFATTDGGGYVANAPPLN